MLYFFVNHFLLVILNIFAIIYEFLEREVFAVVISLVAKKEGFVPGVSYVFDPSVETNCILYGGQGGWKRKSFAEGWCLKFENGEGVFQGRPVNEQNVYFFRVIYGSGGSKAIEK